MEKEEMEENFRALAAEIRGAGFPESVVADLQRQMGQNKSSDIMLFFDAKVGDRNVMGSLYLERESLTGPYRFAHFDVDLGKNSLAPVIENSFVRGSGYAVNLREAVNLMEGRSIYREPSFDRTGQGYWSSLSRDVIAGVYVQEYTRNDFNLAAAIRESQLARWLNAPAQERLAAQLRQGDLVKLAIGPKLHQIEVLVAADPRVKDLRISDPRQQSLELPALSTSHPDQVTIKHGRGR